jgi:hypothetical protein
MEVIRQRLNGPSPEPRRTTAMSEEMTHEVSSGNVFADLGVSKAEEMLAKAQLA